MKFFDFVRKVLDISHL